MGTEFPLLQSIHRTPIGRFPVCFQHSSIDAFSITLYCFSPSISSDLALATSSDGKLSPVYSSQNSPQLSIDPTDTSISTISTSFHTQLVPLRDTDSNTTFATPS